MLYVKLLFLLLMSSGALMSQQYRLVYEEQEITDRYEKLSTQLTGRHRLQMIALNYRITEAELIYEDGISEYSYPGNARYPINYTGEHKQFNTPITFYKDHSANTVLKYAPLLNENCLQTTMRGVAYFVPTDSIKQWQETFIQKAVSLENPSVYVWFCPSIVIADGPKNIAGLPGLVVEHQDELVRTTLISVEEVPANQYRKISRPPCESSVDLETYKAANRQR